MLNKMATTTTLFSNIRTFMKTRPLAKAIVTYGVLWPTGSLIQQSIEGKRLGTYDWMRCARFSLYGGLFSATTLYGWVRLTSTMWPQTNFRVGIVKAIVDQISYGPFSMTCFFIGMSLLELKTFSEACDELKQKFIPTYKVGICIWPFIQFINFSFVPERNRILFISTCSVLWTTFLAYMKQLDMHADELSQPKADQIKLVNEEAIRKL